MGGGGANLRLGGLEDGIAMIFPHHIYCAQSKLKWVAHGVNGGGGMSLRLSPPPPSPIVTPLCRISEHHLRHYNSQCLTCTFRASCCSARLSRTQVPVCTGGYKGVRAVRPEWVAGGWWFEVLWNLECPVRLSQREIIMHAFQ